LRHVFVMMKRDRKCLCCGRRFRLSPRGRPAWYCSASCRQAAYVSRKGKAFDFVQVMARDLAHIKVRAWLRNEIWTLLRQAGLQLPPEPPPIESPRRPKPQLSLVPKPNDQG
jgi:hypothetical protein